jgi:hypothetical protein
MTETTPSPLGNVITRMMSGSRATSTATSSGQRGDQARRRLL